MDDRAYLRDEVPRTALETAFKGRTVRELAQETLRIARSGLHRRARRDHWGNDESHFINALATIAESGRTPATEMLERFQGAWGGNIDPVFREYAY